MWTGSTSGTTGMLCRQVRCHHSEHAPTEDGLQVVSWQWLFRAASDGGTSRGVLGLLAGANGANLECDSLWPCGLSPMDRE